MSAPQATAEGGVRAAVVVLAAGSGVRVGRRTNKVLLSLAGRTVLTWSLARARTLSEVTTLVLVVAERDLEAARTTLSRELAGSEVAIVVGGASRHASEWRALQSLAAPIRAGELDVVVMHDAARPLASAPAFRAVIDVAYRDGGAIPVRPQPSLVPADASMPMPAEVVAVQTPQAFRAGPLLAAYERAEREGFVGTDTASCVERFTDLRVRCLPSSAANIKITYPEDLDLAEQLLAQ